MPHLPPGLRWTWLICLLVLALTPLCDPLLSPLLALGVALVCLLHVIGFALERNAGRRQR